MTALLSPASVGRQIEWEQTDCLLCGSPRRTTLLHAFDLQGPAPRTGFTVVRCRECGLCYTHPRPSPAGMGQFYRAGYRPHRLPEHASWRKRPGGRLRPLGRLDPRGLEKGQLAPHGQCRLLDFGCGGGAFLKRMHERGWHVLGLDASAAAVDHVRRTLGLDALLGTLPHPRLSPRSFDVITMWQSLEHVHQPLEVLQEAYHLLVPGGRLIAAVPNIDSAPFRWFGRDWFGLDLPRHLTHFSPATLRRMFARAGFRVETVRMVRHSGWLRASAERAAQRRRGAGRLRWLTARPLCRLVSLYCLLSRQSDCILATARPILGGR